MHLDVFLRRTWWNLWCKDQKGEFKHVDIGDIVFIEDGMSKGGYAQMRIIEIIRDLVANSLVSAYLVLVSDLTGAKIQVSPSMVFFERPDPRYPRGDPRNRSHEVVVIRNGRKITFKDQEALNKYIAEEEAK